jgi:hypothetical protein
MSTQRAPHRPWWITTDRGPLKDQRCKKVAGPFMTAAEAQESRARIEQYTGKLTFWIVSEDES